MGGGARYRAKRADADGVGWWVVEGKDEQWHLWRTRAPRGLAAPPLPGAAAAPSRLGRGPRWKILAFPPPLSRSHVAEIVKRRAPRLESFS